MTAASPPVTAPNPYVDEPETAAVEGAGVVQSVVDANDSIIDGDPLNIATDVGSAAIDALGVVMDPVGNLASAGVGWLLEHVGFLREPLDALAGDPDAIKAQASTWHKVGAGLTAIADENSAAARGLGSWEGDAGSGYKIAAGEWSGELRGAADAAEELAGRLISSAAWVASTRTFIRDLIADWVGKLIRWAVGALASSWFTAGGSLVALGLAAAAEALALGRKCLDLIKKVVDGLGEAAGAVARVVEKLGELAGRAVQRAERADELLGRYHATDVLGTVKNVHQAGTQEDEWARTGG